MKASPIDRVWNKEHFMEKSCKRLLVPDPFLILANNSKQILHAINSFRNKTIWKKIIKKPWES